MDKKKKQTFLIKSVVYSQNIFLEKHSAEFTAKFTAKLFSLQCSLAGQVSKQTAAWVHARMYIYSNYVGFFTQV